MTERKKVLLRLDPDVYDAIARWAADDLRSVNAQIEFALRRALSGAGRGSARPARTSDVQPDAEPAAGDDGEGPRSSVDDQPA
jgi:hypothetical protein